MFSSQLHSFALIGATVGVTPFPVLFLSVVQAAPTALGVAYARNERPGEDRDR